MMCPEGHRHGEVSTCYSIHGCRCDDCRRGLRERQQWRRKQIAYGRSTNELVPVDLAAAHVARLKAAGMPVQQIALRAGLRRSQLQQIAAKRTRRVQKRTHDAILGVQFAPSPHSHVPSLGAQRRLQALTWLGWESREIGTALGMDGTTVAWILRTDRITLRTHERVAEVFEQLCMKFPDGRGATRARMRARRRGWVGPLAWNDVDDPAEQPERKEAA